MGISQRHVKPNPFIAETIPGGHCPKATPTGLARTCYAVKAVYSVACLEWGKRIGEQAQRRSADGHASLLHETCPAKEAKGGEICQGKLLDWYST